MTTISIKISPELICAGANEIVIEIDGDGIHAGKVAAQGDGVGTLGYMETAIARLEGCGRHGTADNYRCAMRSFRRFCGGEDPALCRLDGNTVKMYEAYLKGNGLKMNTVSFYMRALRAMYNMAVAEKATVDNHPFSNVYTGIAPTIKRAIALDAIRKISRLHAASRRTMLARDMFMFSFYTRGMSFVDMAYLRKADLRDGVLTYKRKKTGQEMTVKWEKCMQDIIDAHPSGNDVYLLPIIRDTGRDARTQYKNMQREVNAQLAKIAVALRIGTGLTMYTARHSWASAARGMGTQVEVISAALGHSSIKTTQIYLKEIDRRVIDNVNMRILGTV